MTQTRDPDAIVAAWLESGPTELPDETRRAITIALRTQPRASRMALPGGIMTSLSRLTVAAGLVLAVGVVGILAFNRAGGNGAQPPSPSPSALAGGASPAASVPLSAPSAASSASASAAISTARWKTFTSARYGYDIRYPATWTPAPSTRQWTMAKDQRDWQSPAADQFVGPPLFAVFAVDLPAGTTADQWITRYFGPDGTGANPCSIAPNPDAGTLVDGHAAVRYTELPTSSSCGAYYAFVTVGTRLYSFTVWETGYEPDLDAFLSTVKFHT